MPARVRLDALPHIIQARQEAQRREDFLNEFLPPLKTPSDCRVCDKRHPVASLARECEERDLNLTTT